MRLKRGMWVKRWSSQLKRFLPPVLLVGKVDVDAHGERWEATLEGDHVTHPVWVNRFRFVGYGESGYHQEFVLKQPPF